MARFHPGGWAGYTISEIVGPKVPAYRYGLQPASLPKPGIGASKVLANIELLSHGAELEEQIALLDHYLDHTQRLCENNMQEAGDQEAEQQ